MLGQDHSAHRIMSYRGLGAGVQGCDVCSERGFTPNDVSVPWDQMGITGEAVAGL